MAIESLGTYLPPWGRADARCPGPDEDAVTLAVEAGRAALGDRQAEVRRVVLVTRDHALLEGGSAGVLLAGLGLADDLEVVERLGGAPATLDALGGAGQGTLVIGVDARTPAGAGAAWYANRGLDLAPPVRVTRSLPIRTRAADGRVSEYDDPRLVRDRGWRASLDRTGWADFGVVAGLAAREARELQREPTDPLPTLGASSPLFALAEAAERGVGGPILAVEQASVSVADFEPAPGVTVARHAPEPSPDLPAPSATASDIKISLPAYVRAFDAKLRLEAVRCPSCATLSYPPRRWCGECGEEGDGEVVPLPTDATVYTSVVVRVPVPGLQTPYGLVVAQLGDTGVRVLTTVSGPRRGEPMRIGTKGALALRRLAVRSGVPDYGYAFVPARSS